MISKRTITIAAALAIIFVSSMPPITGFAASKTKTPTCQQQVQQVNYRSSILAAYKQTQDKRFNSIHNQWATRIGYAAQWVPGDAQKTRDTLYKYDATHEKLDKDLSAQITAYKSLQTHPLTCSKADQAKLKVRMKDIQGKKSGNALLKKDKTAETKFANGEFKQSKTTLLQKLHQARVKHPQPSHPKLAVKKLT